MTETGGSAPQEAITPPPAPPALGTPYPNPRGTESFINDEIAENAEEIRAQHRETSSAEHDRDKLERLLHLERIYLDKSERSPQDIIDILLGLTTDELTRLDAEKKYGRNFFGNLKRSFNELYSVTHTDGQQRTAMNRGAMARDALKRIGRAVFNRRNVTAVAAATAMTVLTGGMGSTTLLAAGGGVLGAMGAEVADVFKGESGTLGARKELFIAEQERWAQLKSLALSYQAEMDRGYPEGVNVHHELAPDERLAQGNHEALRILRQIIDIYYMQGESFYVKRILDAQNSLGLKEEQLTKSRNKWMAIGGIAGAAGGTAVDLLSGSFAPIDLDLQVNPQEWAHGVQRVGDKWTWVASAAEQAAGITGGNLANSTANIVAVNFAERGAAIVAAAYLAGGMADNDWIINSGNTRGFESNKAAILQNEEKRKDYFDHLRSQVQSNDEYFQKIADQFGVVVPENPVTDMPYDWVRQPQLIPKENFNFSKVPTWLKRMVPDRTAGLDPAEFGSEMYRVDVFNGGFVEYAVAGVNKERNKIALVSIMAQGDAEAYVVTVMDLDRFLTEYKPDIKVKGGDVNWPAAQGGGHENTPPVDPVGPDGTNPRNPDEPNDPPITNPDNDQTPDPDPEPQSEPDTPRSPEEGVTVDRISDDVVSNKVHFFTKINPDGSRTEVAIGAIIRPVVVGEGVDGAVYQTSRVEKITKKDEKYYIKTQNSLYEFDPSKSIDSIQAREQKDNESTEREKEKLISEAKTFDELIAAVNKIGGSANNETGGYDIAQNIIYRLRVVRDNKDQDINIITRDYGIRAAAQRLRDAQNLQENSSKNNKERAGESLTDQELIMREINSQETSKHLYERKIYPGDDTAVFYGFFADLQHRFHKLPEDSSDISFNHNKKSGFAYVNNLGDEGKQTTVRFRISNMDKISVQVNRGKGFEDTNLGNMIDLLRTATEKVELAEKTMSERPSSPKPVEQKFEDDEGARKPRPGFRRVDPSENSAEDFDESPRVTSTESTNGHNPRDKYKDPLTIKPFENLADKLKEEGWDLSDGSEEGTTTNQKSVETTSSEIAESDSTDEGAIDTGSSEVKAGDDVVESEILDLLEEYGIDGEDLAQGKNIKLDLLRPSANGIREQLGISVENQEMPIEYNILENQWDENENDFVFGLSRVGDSSGNISFINFKQLIPFVLKK